MFTEVKELKISKETLEKIKKLNREVDPMVREQYEEIGVTCKIIMYWLDSNGTWIIESIDDNIEEYDIEWTKYLNKEFYNTHVNDNSYFGIKITVVEEAIKAKENTIIYKETNKVDEILDNDLFNLF